MEVTVFTGLPVIDQVDVALTVVAQERTAVTNGVTKSVIRAIDLPAQCVVVEEV
jgi:hypothetical protein